MAENPALGKKWVRLTVSLLIFAILGGTIFCIWAWPKSHPLSRGQDLTGYYRGLDWTPGPGFFGRQYFLLENDMGPEGRWTIYYRGPGYNKHHSFYPDGTLKEEGECLVETYGDAEPMPDKHNVKSGKYYRPDGTLGSSVIDGTGIQTYWHPDGTKSWELKLQDFRRVRHAWWYPNGQLIQAQDYVDGEVHGKYQSFYRDSTVETQGEYDHGKEVGKWIRYDADGNVKSVEDHSSSQTE